MPFWCSFLTVHHWGQCPHYDRFPTSLMSKRNPSNYVASWRTHSESARCSPFWLSLWWELSPSLAWTALAFPRHFSATVHGSHSHAQAHLSHSALNTGCSMAVSTQGLTPFLYLEYCPSYFPTISPCEWHFPDYLILNRISYLYPLHWPLLIALTDTLDR